MKRYRKDLITRRILAMAAAASLFVSPSISFAQNIQKAESSKASTIKVDGKVTNVTPDRTTNGGKTAVNHFKHFELDKGNIANLHLGGSDSLVNFVDEKASINGIVNSVKDNKVAGNLYFLSSKGIAVGSSGVINADKVNLIAPHADIYSAMVNSSALNDQTLSRAALDAYPLNASGSIVVDGTINAPQGINIFARDISINGTLNNTKDLDYSKIVNTTDEQGNIISAGLSSQSLDLTATNDGIYISAHINNDEAGLDAGFTDLIGIGVEHLAEPAVVSINVGENAVIKSSADVDISAAITPTRTNDPYSNFRAYTTSIDVAGSIDAQNISIQSVINDSFAKASVVTKKADEDEATQIAKLFDLFSLINIQNILQDYGHVGNAFVARFDEANLNIKNTASLNASKDINLDSVSNFKTQLLSQVTSTDDYGGAALNFTYLNNAADMKVAGNLKAGNDIKLNSTAGADISSYANITFDKSNNTASTLALNVLKGDSNSTLTVDEGAVIDAGGAMSLTALANSPLEMQTSIQRIGSDLGALSFNFDMFNSQSLLDISGELKAVGDVNLASKYTAATKEVLGGIIVSNPIANATQTEEEAKKTQQATDTINNATKEQGGSDNTKTSSVTINGATIIENNSAYLAADKVTSTNGALNIESSADLGDAQAGGFSITAASKGGNVSPVFLFQKMNNTSATQLTGDLSAKSINVKSNVVLNNPRLDKALEDVRNLTTRLANVYDKINSASINDKEAFEEVKKRLTKYLEDIKSGTNPQQALTSSTQDIINDLKEYLASDEDVQKIISTLETAVDATQIANFYADKETLINTKEAKPDYTVTAASLTNLLNNASSIEIDQGLTFRATDGDLNLSSNIEDKTLNVTGHILPKNLKTAATDLIAGVNILGDDNQIKSKGNLTLMGKKVSVDTTNNINHLLINNGSGIGANSSYHAVGTVGYAGGTSNAIINLGAAPKISASDSFKLNSLNDTQALNIAGGLSFGSGSAGIGVGVAVNNFDISTGAAAGGGTLGAIVTPKIDVNAKTSGMVNALSVAGGLSTSSDDSKSFIEKNADESSKTKNSSGIGVLDNLAEYVGEDNLKAISDVVEYFNKAKGVVNDTKGKIDKAINDVTGGDKPDTNVPSTEKLSSNDSQPKVTFDGAGSASVNLGSRSTQAMLAGFNTQDVTEVNSSALDKNFTGAWSGAGALNFRGGKGTSVAIAGAVAVNKVDSSVNSTLGYTSGLQGTINNSAEKSGALVAAGLGLTVSTSNGGKNFAGAASASVNLSKNDVKANLSNNVVASADNIANIAKNTDTQVTGGVNVAIAAGGSGAAMGGSGVWSDIANDVDALVEGGTYNLTGDFKNQVGTTLTDVAAGAGVGVSTGGYGVQGVFTYNKILNDAAALVKDSSITSKNFINTSTDSTDGLKTYDSMLSNSGLDVTGDSYTEFAKIGGASSTKTTINNKAAGKDGVEEDTSKGYVNSDYGNKIITASLAIAGSKKGSAQASIAISDVDNDFSAEVTGTDLKTTSTADIVATSNTLDVSAAAGAAIAGSGFGAGGSVSWQVNDNDITAGFDGGSSQKTLAADTLNINTNNKALEVNVAGQVSGGSGVAAGLGMAYNALSDSTNSYLKNAKLGTKKTITIHYYKVWTDDSVFNLEDYLKAHPEVKVVDGPIKHNGWTYYQLESAEGKVPDPHRTSTGAVGRRQETIVEGGVQNLNLSAESGGKVYAVGAGVAASSSSAALNGVVGVNHGSNSTSASIENVSADSIKALDVNVKDSVDKMAIVGGLTFSGGNVAVGGSVALNDVGSIGTTQKTKASIKNSTLNVTDDLNVNVDDGTELLTVGVGVGLSTGSVAVQGAAAVSTINKEVGIDINDSDLSAKNIALNAKTSEDLITTADVLSVSNTAAVGAGVSINNDNTKTKVSVSNKALKADSIKINSANDSKVLTIGIGASAAASGASVNGSVALNNLNTQTSNNLSGTTLDTKSLLVDAQGDESIANYGGNLSLSGSGASVGLSVSINNINSDVTSNVSQSTIKNVANNSLSVNNLVEDSAIRDSVADKDTFRSSTALRDSRKAQTYKGALINASATHDIKSALFNVAATGSGAAVNGTVNINRINGSTKATTNELNYNNSADVNVVANDYSNASGLVGTGSIALTGAGVGLGNDTSLLNRETIATLDGKDKFKAKVVNVNANGKSGVGSLVAGIAFAAEGAGLSNGVDVSLLKSKTSATASDLDGSADTLNVNSLNKTNLNTLGVSAGVNGVGAGVGLSVDVINNEADTSSNLRRSNLTLSGDANVKANTNNKIAYEMYDVGASAIGGGVAGAIAVVNQNSKTTSLLAENTISSKNLSVNSTNDLNFKNRAIVGGLAGLGGGVGVGVSINTIDSSVNTNVDSNIKATSVNINATENRNIDQRAAAASAGAGAASANVMITNVGDELKDYKSTLNDENDGASVNSSEQINKVNNATSNDALGGDNIKVGTMDVALVKGSDKVATYGGTSGSGTHITLKGNVEASSINVNNVANNEFNVESWSGALGGGALNGNVGIVNIKKNATTDLNGTLNGNLNVLNSNAGTQTLKIRQGSGGLGLAANVSYADLNTKGLNVINLNNATIKGDKASIETKDTSSAKVDSIGVAVSGGVAAGVLIADSSLASANQININNSTFDSPSITLSAGGDPRAEVKATAANAAAFGAATGLFAGTSNSTSNSLNVDGKTTLNSTGNINLNATNNSSVTTKTDSVAASLGVGGSVTSINNKSNAAALINFKGSIKGNRTSSTSTADINKKKTTYTAEFDSTDYNLYDYFANNPDVTIKEKQQVNGDSTYIATINRSLIQGWTTSDFNALNNKLKQYNLKSLSLSAHKSPLNLIDRVDIQATANDKSNLAALEKLLNEYNASYEVITSTHTHYKLSSDYVISQPKGAYNFKRGTEDSTIKTGSKTTVNYKGANPVVKVNATSNPKQYVDLLSIGVGGLLSASGSVANVDSTSTAQANLNANIINAQDLNVNTSAQSTPSVKVKGLNVGAIASGSNLIKSNRQLNANSTLSANTSELDKVTLSNTATSTPTLDVNGDGGGLVEVSPKAASLADNLTSNAIINLGGTLNIRDGINVKSINSDGGTFKADALGASVIGGSGVDLNRSTLNNTQININSAKVLSGGAQTYEATNNLGANVDLEAAGYGGLNATAGGLSHNTTYNAAVNSNNSVLSTTGSDSSIDATANTVGRVSVLNNLKAAGAIEVVASGSVIGTKFNNTVNVNGGTLKTDGNDADINLSTYDKTEQRYQTIANIQGGAAGVALATEVNNLSRNNTTSTTNKAFIESSNNLNLNSGSDTSNAPGKLTLTTFADVYNKTALPLSSSPKMDNTLSLSNSVNVGKGANVRAVRDINFNADAGTELITESAKEYNIYTGESGKGKVIVTTGHEGNPDESQNNFVQVDGKAETGIHNTLTIELSGNYSINGNKEVNDIKVKVNDEGLKFFDPSGIDYSAQATVHNPFLQDYNEAISNMMAYAPGSDAYNKLKAQADGIAKTMQAYGFASVKDGAYTIYDQIAGPAIEMPSAHVAGGNIDINSPNVKGSGQLIANAANKLEVTNRTNKTLLLNDLIMDNAGGKIYWNDVTQGGYIGSVKLTTSSDVTPQLTVSNVGNSYNSPGSTTNPAMSKAPDITVNGKISNSAGGVRLYNKNGSVFVNGSVFSLTRTSIETPSGSTIINNTAGLTNVGEDPMLKYTFGNKKFTDELQVYVGQKGVNKNFSSYDEYLRWLWTDVSISWERCNELSGLSGRNYNVDTWIKAMKAKYDKSSEEPAGKIVAGGAVSVIAKTLNINGLIQSGFSSYTGETSLSAYNAIRNNKNLKGSTSDADIIGNSAYRVNDTSADFTYNKSTGRYDKVVGLYFNPKTNHILAEPVQVTGGVVYIKADDVISTGNGKIVAAGGAADLNLIGNSEADFVIGDINTNSRGNPLIMINGKDVTNDKTYTPNKNLTYSWTGGINYNTIATKSSTLTKWLWGAIKGKSTKALVDKLNQENASIRTMNTSAGKTGDPLQNGVYIGNNGNSNYDFSINTQKRTGSTIYGETTTDSYYAKWYDYIISRKTVKYTWTETTPNYANSTYSVNASKPISISAVNGKSGSVTITNDANLIVSGNIEQGNNSSINLKSRWGTIKTETGHRLNDQFVTLSAEKGIDAELGAGVAGQVSTLNATSSRGDITLKLNTNLNSASKYQAAGKVTLSGTGDIKGKVDKATDLNVETSGAINMTGKATGNVTLKGTKQVAYVQESGDLKLTKVVSNGDVNLTASNGAIVNAVDKATSMTGSEERLQSWIDAGIISDKDSDSSSTNAGKAEKEVRLKGIDNLFRQWSIRAEDETKQETFYQRSFKVVSGWAQMQLNKLIRNNNIKVISQQGLNETIELNKAQAKILDAFDFRGGLKNIQQKTITKEVEYKAGTLDEDKYDSLINHKADTTTLTTGELKMYELYKELKDNNDYGFSKNQLLYTIQEGILNPEAGITADVPEPTISGKTVSLTAKSIGKDLESVTYKDLTNINTLKKLAGAKMGDVTFNKDGSITLSEQSPVTVDLLSEGTNLKIDTSGKTYVAGTNRTAMNIGTEINVPNDKVVLMTGDGIKDDRLLSAKTLELYAGAGELSVTNLKMPYDPKNASRPISSVTANASEKVTIQAIGQIPIKNITAGKTVYLETMDNDYSLYYPIVAADGSSKIKAGESITFKTKDSKIKNGDYRLQVDTVNVNVVEGSGTLTEPEGDYRYVNTVDSAGKVKRQTKNKYTFKVMEDGDYWINRKSFVDVYLKGNTKNVTIKSIGDLYLERLNADHSGVDEVGIYAGGDIISSGDLQIGESEYKKLLLSANNIRGVRTETPNVTVNVAGTLDLSYKNLNGNTLSKDLNLTSEKDLKISNLDANGAAVNIKVAGDYTAGKVTAKSAKVEATGDITLNNYPNRANDSYTAANINVTVDDANKVYNHLSSMNAKYVFKAEDPKRVYYKVNETPSNTLDMTTDKPVSISMSKTDKMLKVKSDKDLNIKAESDVFFNMTNAEHATNIEAGKNEVTLFSMENLRGKMNGKAVTVWCIEDLDLTTDTKDLALFAENVKLTTNKATIEDLQKGSLVFTDKFEMTTPSKVYLKSKSKEASFEVQSGSRGVEVEAAGDVSIKTDNLKLDSASVGGKLKVESDKDITGSLEAESVDLKAGGNLDIKSEGNITGKTRISGTINANSNKDINLEQSDSILYIGQIRALGNVELRTTNTHIRRASGGVARGLHVGVRSRKALGTNSTPVYIEYVTGYAATRGSSYWLWNATARRVADWRNYEERGLEERESSANKKELEQVAKALNESNILTGKSGEAYNATIRAWLLGMGYSESEEAEIIKLTREMYFNDVSGSSLLMKGIEEIAGQYSEANLNYNA